KEDGTENDPGNGKQSECGAIQRGQYGELYRHSISGKGNDERRYQGRERRHPGRFSKRSQHHKQYDDWNDCHERRHTETVRDRLIIVLPHSLSSPKFKNGSGTLPYFSRENLASDQVAVRFGGKARGA